ncbi:MAG: VWA domain-containing protein [Clostridiales bacterium]|nr:VWA domain-containing protein [Clostridiales bacterium]
MECTVMSNISFDNAYWLLIAVPLIVLFTIPFAIATRKENVNGHSITSYVLHIIMAVIIAFAAAGTGITTTLTETNVYVVADVSYSVRENLDTIDGYIRNIKLPHNSKLGLVCFGKDYEVVSEMGNPRDVGSVKNSNVDDSETNVAEALEYTATLFKEDVIKRVVLITDGSQTDTSDSYAITRAVDSLIAQGIKVDAIYLDSNLKEGTKEVQISEVKATNTAFLNSNETAEVTIRTSYNTNAVVTLYLDGQMYRERAVTLTAGYNTVSFDLVTARNGTFDYEVHVEAEGDDNPFNNSYLFTQIVSSNIKVLAVTEKWADVVTIVERYGGKASIDVFEYDSSVTPSTKTQFINKYAGNGKINIHRLNRDIPFTIEQIIGYDEIILADVNMTNLTNYTEFAKNLNTAVSTFGKSLVTFGNLQIQNISDPDIIQFKNMLPVNFGGSEDPKIYTFVIDSSRSMDHLSHFDLAKQLCARLIDILNDDDYVCVVTFNGDVKMVQPPRPLTSRADIIDAINKLEARQGTVIGRGLEMAYQYMGDDSLYSNKQIMLITDGLSYGSSSDAPDVLAREMYNEAGIVTSVFDVGRQGSDSDGANLVAKNLLNKIASNGHGNYFFADNEDSLSDAKFGEVAQQVSVSIIEAETTVNASQRWDKVLNGIDTSAIPDVSGYVYSTIKAGATNVLTVNHKKSTGITPRPLYSYWSYGTGQVSSFTSQMAGKWVQNWSDSGVLLDFMDNVFYSNTPKVKSDAPFNVAVTREGKMAYVEVTPAVLHFNASAKIEIIKPSGEVETADFKFNSSYYFYEFTTDDIGKYNVTISYTYYGTDHLADASFNISYSPEYDEFYPSDITVLYKALDGRGTVADNENLKLENDPDEVATYIVQLTVPLLIAVVALFVVDIIVRKLKWDDVITFIKFLKKIMHKKQEVK